MDTARKPCTDVFVVEDSEAIRSRLLTILGDLPQVSVVGEAVSPKEAIEGILRTHPTLVVLDIRLIGGSGIEVLRAIKPRHPEIVFAVLTNHTETQYRNVCLRAGASYFLDKTQEFESIKDVLAEVGHATPPEIQHHSSWGALI